MALPIGPTPTLEGDDVDRFFEEMDTAEKTPLDIPEDELRKTKLIYDKISRGSVIRFG